MSMEKINQLRIQIMELRGQVAALQKALPVEAVKDYRFESESGSVSLSALFADKQSLYVVHNMGTSCNYCMLWADGFNGVSQHLLDHSAFVISSPDSVETQQAYRSERGWNFPMVSVKITRLPQIWGLHLTRVTCPVCLSLNATVIPLCALGHRCSARGMTSAQCGTSWI